MDFCSYCKRERGSKQKVKFKLHILEYKTQQTSSMHFCRPKCKIRGIFVISVTLCLGQKSEFIYILALYVRLWKFSRNTNRRCPDQTTEVLSPKLLSSKLLLPFETTHALHHHHSKEDIFLIIFFSSRRPFYREVRWTKDERGAFSTFNKMEMEGILEKLWKSWLRLNQGDWLPRRNGGNSRFRFNSTIGWKHRKREHLAIYIYIYIFLINSTRFFFEEPCRICICKCKLLLSLKGK